MFTPLLCRVREKRSDEKPEEKICDNIYASPEQMTRRRDRTVAEFNREQKNEIKIYLPTLIYNSTLFLPFSAPFVAVREEYNVIYDIYTIYLYKRRKKMMIRNVEWKTDDGCLSGY